MKVKLSNVRLAFPVLWEAKTVNGEGKPAFSAAFIFDKDSKNVALLTDAIQSVAKDKWGEKAEALIKQMKAANKICVQDGDLKSQYAGYEGNMFVTARGTTRPLVLDADKTPLAEADGRPYAGCYVNATISLWAMDNKYGKRINATLGGVQFFRDGEAFAGGMVASNDDFDDVSDGADADDLV